jgi:hypothetical protein
VTGGVAPLNHRLRGLNAFGIGVCRQMTPEVGPRENAAGISVGDAKFIKWAAQLTTLKPKQIGEGLQILP